PGDPDRRRRRSHGTGRRSGFGARPPRGASAHVDAGASARQHTEALLVAQCGGVLSSPRRFAAGCNSERANYFLRLVRLSESEWMKQLIFWSSVLFILYTYAGYPLLLWAWRRLTGPRPPLEGSETPFVSILVTVRNEVEHIRRKIQDLLAIDYPA